MTSSFENIKFNEIFLTGFELDRVARALFPGSTSSRLFKEEVVSQIKKIYTNSSNVYVTSSIAAAYEMLCDLIALRSGDKVLMPSYIGVEAANAFVKRGATISFIDSESKNPLMEVRNLTTLVDSATKLVLCNSYQGEFVNIGRIKSEIKNKKTIFVEDLTQSFAGNRDDKKNFFDYQIADFHHSNYLHAFEAGAIISFRNDGDNFNLAKNRGLDVAYFRPETNMAFDWIAKGGEYSTNEITAAFLSAQLDQVEALKELRCLVWKRYTECLTLMDTNKFLGLPQNFDSEMAYGNYYVTLPQQVSRANIIDDLLRVGIETRGHFLPLHLTKQGRSLGVITLPNIEKLHGSILRLPSHNNIHPEKINRIVKLLLRVLENRLGFNK